MKSPFATAGKYNTLAIIIVGGFVGALALGILLIRPAWQGLQEVNKEVPIEKRKEKQAELDQKALTDAKSFFAKNRTDVERVTTAVPIEPNVPAILVILESLSKARNVQLASFSPQQTGTAAGSGTTAAPGSPAAADSAGTAGASSVEITANYRGQYNDLISFFFDLENSLRIVDVKGLSVTTNRENGIEGSIVFRAYYKPAADKVTSSPAPTPGGVK